MRIGAKRSPLRTPEQAAALAREIAARRGLELDGLMMYEAQIAGVGDRPPGNALLGAALRAMQRASARELAARRAAVVGRRCRRCGSSTAAAPGRSSARPPSRR